MRDALLRRPVAKPAARAPPSSLARYYAQSDQRNATNSRAHRRRRLPIVGAGLSKTGTTSLAEALQRLGYRVRHFDPEPNGLTSLMLGTQGWYSKPSPRSREAHYARLHSYFWQSGLEAVADLPFPGETSETSRCALAPRARHIPVLPANDSRPHLAGFVEELVAAFPDALVVLTVRKDVLRWVASAATQLNRYRAQTDLIRSTTYQVRLTLSTSKSNAEVS